MHPYFVGLDVHKQVIAYCVKTADGEIVSEGKIAATRTGLDQWVNTLPGPWHGSLEATLFSHWIFRHLEPHAARLEMGHPARMKAISAGKKKSDKLDARTLADLLRANLFPDEGSSDNGHPEVRSSNFRKRCSPQHGMSPAGESGFLFRSGSTTGHGAQRSSANPRGTGASSSRETLILLRRRRRTVASTFVPCSRSSRPRFGVPVFRPPMRNSSYFSPVRWTSCRPGWGEGSGATEENSANTP
jgi:hypothetical protein